MILSVQNVVKTYGDYMAVNHVSIDVQKGSVFGMLGPNGAGKTSLIRMITTITAPDSGSIFLDGHKLHSRSPEQIGYMPEERGLYKKMKVGEQLLYLAQLKGLTKAQAMQEIDVWLTKFDIKDWWGKKVEDQSWLPRSMTTPTDTEQVVRIYNYMALNLEDPLYQEVLPSWAYETPEKLTQLLDELSAYEQEQTGPLSLLHGDSHQGNSYVDANGRRRWVDFQLARKGTPWRDLCYFMVAALTVEERVSADRDLVQLYRETLMSAGAESVPSQDEAWDQFRRWPAYGMQCWLGNVDRWGQTGVEMIRRFYAAGDDYDTVALLTAGKKPRRIVKLGEEASPLPPDLQAILDSRRT